MNTLVGINKKLMAYVFVAVLVSFLSFCNDEAQPQLKNSSTFIKAGFICGWGSGMDTITITQTLITYALYIPSKSPEPQIIKAKKNSDSEWTEIINCFNVDDFQKLNNHTCNVCADGCDDWIFIQTDKISHKISYTNGSEIAVISKLQAQISALRSEFTK